MIYTVNIENAKEESGKIQLDRLIKIVTSFTKISEGALKLKLFGLSNKRGRLGTDIENALSVRLIGLKNQSTALVFECDQFKTKLESYQSDIYETNFFNHTPISIVIWCYKSILNEEETNIFIDRPLIHNLKELIHSFKSNDEILSIVNETDSISLTKNKIESIHSTELKIPEDRKLIINGLVEELKYSKYRVKIKMKNELLNGYISNKIKPERLAIYWGKNITLSGIMHYGINNTKNFEITGIHEENDDIQFFKEIPIQSQLVEKVAANPLLRWKGKWPGDESLDELIDSI